MDGCTEHKRVKEMEPLWLPEYCQLVLLLPGRRTDESLGKVSSLRKDLKIMTGRSTVRRPNWSTH